MKLYSLSRIVFFLVFLLAAPTSTEGAAVLQTLPGIGPIIKVIFGALTAIFRRDLDSDAERFGTLLPPDWDFDAVQKRAPHATIEDCLTEIEDSRYTGVVGADYILVNQVGPLCKVYGALTNLRSDRLEIEAEFGVTRFVNNTAIVFYDLPQETLSQAQEFVQSNS